MKLVFAHDHIFYKYEEEFYSTGGLSSEVLQRYTNVFEEVIILSRQKILEDNYNNLTLASSPRVRFVEIPNFKKIKNLYLINMAKKIIQNELKGANALIARLPSSIGNLAVKEAEKKGVPHLLEVVACPWNSLWNHGKVGKIIAPIAYAKMKSYVKKAPYVLYVTNNFLQRRYPTNGLSTNCSNVNLKKIEVKSLTDRINKIENDNDDKKVILGTTAAVNVKSKGQQYIIQALGELKESGISNYEYQLVGSGDSNYLKNIAERFNVKEQVKFIGSLKHNQVFEWLQNIDIYVQPSRQEGLPRALVEAMSMAVPSFGADTAGIPELLDKEFIFSNKSSSNIMEIANIISNLKNKNVLKEQSKRNYAVSKKFEFELLEDRRKKFYNEFKSYCIEKSTF
jgi:glycosyltransferase involved in cell wall biosynthesis